MKIACVIEFQNEYAICLWPFFFLYERAMFLFRAIIVCDFGQSIRCLKPK